MNLYGYDFQVIIYTNPGDGTFGSSLDVSSSLISANPLNLGVDQKVTRIMPGSTSIKVTDTDQAIWTFIDTALEVSNGLFTPFLEIYIDGVLRFTGIIKPSGLSRDLKTRTVQISADSWDAVLGDAVLTDWKRTLPASNVASPSVSVNATPSVPDYFIHFAWEFIAIDRLIGFVDIVKFQAVGLKEGMTVTLTSGDWLAATTQATIKQIMAVGSNYTVALMDRYVWKDPGSNQSKDNITMHGTVQIPTNTTTPVSTWVCTESFVYSDTAPKKYNIKLSTLDGIVPGDTLQTIPVDGQTTTFLIVDIDPTRNEILVAEPVAINLSTTTELFLDDASKQMIPFVDPIYAIKRAAWIGRGVSTNRYTPPSYEYAFFNWIPIRPFSAQGENLYAPSDLQLSLTDIEVQTGLSLQWHGNETNWQPLSSYTKKAIWSSQTSTPPTYNIIDQTNTYAKNQRPRNINLKSWKIRAFDPDDGTYTPTNNDSLGQMVAHDCAKLRRFRYSAGTLTYEKYNGVSWSAEGSTAVLPTRIKDSCLFVGQSSSLAGGGAPLLIMTTGNQLQAFLTSTALTPLQLTVDQSLGFLVETINGPYLVSKSGYGKIGVTSGAISIAWTTVTGTGDINMVPSTFCYLPALNQCFCLADVDFAAIDPKNIKHETWSLALAGTPTGQTKDIIAFDKIFAGQTRNAQAIYDPFGQRIVGLVGGRLFQFSNHGYFTLERIDPTNMSALELIEHTCQVLNAIAVPSATGYLDLVPRIATSTATIINQVDYSITQRRLSGDFFSAVRVVASDDTVYADSYSSKLGGNVLEFSSHPFIFTGSECKAVANSYCHFFGKPRREEDRTIKLDNQIMDLIPYQLIQFSGETKQWYVKKVSLNFEKHEAQLTLLEATTNASTIPNY